MIRTASLVLLGLAVGLAVVGCGKKQEERKPDLPVTSTPGVDKKGKQQKVMEAGIEYPPKK